MKQILFTTILFIIFFSNTYGQSNPNSAVTGKVFDKTTKLPLEYSTITIVNRLTGKIVTGSVADSHGSFTITDIPSGTYKVNVEFIGYNRSSIDSISISSNKHSVSVGTIFLSPSTLSIQDVTVIGNKPIIENKIDKVVYNAANDITSQGGLAIDVLKKVPQVTVDIDGNVELQGNSNIRFLINGKPSTVFGSNVADALASIPAAQIKSVEAITSPGAKYDSQGTGGIINIILQNNKMKGFNGNVNLSAGTKLENGSLNFNLRRKNFGVNLFFGGNAQLKSQMPSSQNRLTTDSTTNKVNSLLQNGLTDITRNGFRTGSGFDWSISKNDNLNGSIGYNQFNSHNQGLINQEELIKDLLFNPISDLFSTRYSVSQSDFKSLDLSLDYKRKFKKEGQELDFLFSSSMGRPDMHYTQTQTYQGSLSPYSGSSSLNPGTNNEKNFSVDYAQPVSENFIIETGAKAIFQRLHSVADVNVFNTLSGQFVHDPLQSYDLTYNMNVFAGYFSANFKLFRYLDVKSGIRYEYTDVRINSTNTVVPAYGIVVPTVVISHSIDKNRTLKIAYSKRIERPEYGDLNPFINLSDPYNISVGNPLLKPEIGNNIELGYSNSFKNGGNIYVALLERINTQDKKSITVFYPTYQIGDSIYQNVSVTNQQNIGQEFNTGITASGSFPLSSRINLRGNLMLTHRYLVTELATGNSSTGLRFRVNLNASYQLPRDLVLELFANYSAPARSIQGKIPQFFIYNFAFRKMFWDKKASFGFTTTNPFSKYIDQITTIKTANSYSEKNRQMPIRSFGISLTYKFGKLEFKKSKEELDNNPILEDANHN